MAEMFADVLKARAALRARKDSALDSYVAQAERRERIDREFGERRQPRDPMSPEAIGTLTLDEIKVKYPATGDSRPVGLFSGPRGEEFARLVNDGTPSGDPVTFVKGSAPEGSL